MIVREFITTFVHDNNIYGADHQMKKKTIDCLMIDICFRMLLLKKLCDCWEHSKLNLI